MTSCSSLYSVVRLPSSTFCLSTFVRASKGELLSAFMSRLEDELDEEEC